MLELTNGGKTCSGLKAVEFFEGLADVFDEETKTEEFCEEYEDALNRLRYLAAKDTPQPIRVNSHFWAQGKIVTSCRHCAASVGIPSKYCSQCGTMLEWPDAGHYGDDRYKPDWAQKRKGRK